MEPVGLGLGRRGVPAVILHLKVVTGSAFAAAVTSGLMQAIAEPTSISLVHVLGIMGVGGITGAAGALLILGGYREKVDRHDRAIETKADAEAISTRLDRIEKQLDMLIQKSVNDPHR